jgi:hypothetical protein
MPTDKEIKSSIETILSSKDFKDSPVYKSLLSYLVSSSLAKNVPKEITIAIDVFGKDANFNSNKDSIVRYHVHVLRKKLEDYYKNLGKHDSVRLFIPVGHYEIKFTSARSGSPLIFNRIAAFLLRWEMAVILFLLLLSIYLIILRIHSHNDSALSKKQNAVDPGDMIWGSFFKNGHPISIVIGDDFLLDEFSPELKRYRQIRDWKIDSENDLNNFLIQFPKANLWKSEITGVPFGGVKNLMDILPIADQFQNDVTVTMSSSLSLENVRSRNLIYVGEFKNLRVLNKIIFKTPIRFQYHPDERLFIINEKGDTLNTFVRIEAPYEQLNKYNVDYSLLIKIPGFTSENFMFIVGFGYGGRLERTKMLAGAEDRARLVEEIRKINKSVPDYFIAVFEVKSIERIGFTNELKYFKEIPPGFFNTPE